MKQIKIYTIIISTILSLNIFAAEGQNDKVEDVKKKKQAKSWGVALIAMPFSTPETKWGIPVAVIIAKGNDS